MSLSQLNRHSEAERTLEQAISHFPHSPEPPKHLASMLLQQGRLEEVRTCTLHSPLQSPQTVAKYNIDHFLGETKND